MACSNVMTVCPAHSLAHGVLTMLSEKDTAIILGH